MNSKIIQECLEFLDEESLSAYALCSNACTVAVARVRFEDVSNHGSAVIGVVPDCVGENSDASGGTAIIQRISVGVNVTGQRDLCLPQAFASRMFARATTKDRQLRLGLPVGHSDRTDYSASPSVATGRTRVLRCLDCTDQDMTNLQRAGGTSLKQVQFVSCSDRDIACVRRCPSIRAVRVANATLRSIPKHLPGMFRACNGLYAAGVQLSDSFSLRMSKQGVDFLAQLVLRQTRLRSLVLHANCTQWWNELAARRQLAAEIERYRKKYRRSNNSEKEVVLLGSQASARSAAVDHPAACEHSVHAELGLAHLELITKHPLSLRFLRNFLWSSARMGSVGEERGPSHYCYSHGDRGGVGCDSDSSDSGDSVELASSGGAASGWKSASGIRLEPGLARLGGSLKTLVLPDITGLRAPRMLSQALRPCRNLVALSIDRVLTLSWRRAKQIMRRMVGAALYACPRLLLLKVRGSFMADPENTMQAVLSARRKMHPIRMLSIPGHRNAFWTAPVRSLARGLWDAGVTVVMHGSEGMIRSWQAEARALYSRTAVLKDETTTAVASSAGARPQGGSKYRKKKGKRQVRMRLKQAGPLAAAPTDCERPVYKADSSPCAHGCGASIFYRYVASQAAAWGTGAAAGASGGDASETARLEALSRAQQDHDAVCMAAPTKCPGFGCSWSGPRHDFSAHVDKLCDVWSRGFKYKSPYPLYYREGVPIDSLAAAESAAGTSRASSGTRLQPDELPELKCTNGCGATLRPTRIIYANEECEAPLEQGPSLEQLDHDYCCHLARVGCFMPGCDWTGTRQERIVHANACKQWKTVTPYGCVYPQTADDPHARMIRLLAADGGTRDSAASWSSAGAEHSQRQDAAALAIAVGGTPWLAEVRALQRLIRFEAEAGRDTGDLQSLLIDIGGSICSWIPHTLWKRRDWIRCKFETKHTDASCARSSWGAPPGRLGAAHTGPVSGAGSDVGTVLSSLFAAATGQGTSSGSEGAGEGGYARTHGMGADGLVEGTHAPGFARVCVSRGDMCPVLAHITSDPVPGFAERYREHETRMQYPCVTADDLQRTLSDPRIGPRLARSVAHAERIARPKRQQEKDNIYAQCIAIHQLETRPVAMRDTYGGLLAGQRTRVHEEISRHMDRAMYGRYFGREERKAMIDAHLVRLRKASASANAAVDSCREQLARATGAAQGGAGSASAPAPARPQGAADGYYAPQSSSRGQGSNAGSSSDGSGQGFPCVIS